MNSFKAKKIDFQTALELKRKGKNMTRLEAWNLIPTNHYGISIKSWRWIFFLIFLALIPDYSSAYTVSVDHPRLFLTPASLEILKAKLPNDADFKELKTYIDEKIIDPSDTIKGLEGEMPDEIARRFLLVAVVTDDPKYISAAKNIVLKVADMSPAGLNRTNYRIRNRLMAMALGYDWLHDKKTVSGPWSNDELKILQDRMLEYIEAFDADNHWDKTDKYISSPVDFASSGSSRVANAAGLAAVLAAYGDDTRFDSKRKIIVQNWINGYNPAISVFGKGGSHHMGWRYGVHYGTLKPYLIWNTATGERWADEYVRDTPYMFIYGVNRFGTLPLFGDCRDNKINADIVDNLSISSMLSGNRYAAWFMGKHFEKIWAVHKPLYLISKAKAVSAKSPDDLPLGRHFEGTGFVIARSGWKEDSAILTFKSSPFASRTHRHCDENSFVLDYNGTILCDSGFYDNWNTTHWNNYYSRSIAHNTMVIRPSTGEGDDGGQKIPSAIEPKSAAELQESRFALGGIKKFSQNDGCVWMRGDAAKSYDSSMVKGYERDVLFVSKASGLNNSAVFVVDRVNLAANKKPVILWHLIQEPKFSADKKYAMTGNGNGGFARLEFSDAEKMEISAIGGIGREFEVNGINYPPGDLVGGMSGGDPGQWGRIEVSPKTGAVKQTLSTLIIIDNQEVTEEKLSKGIFIAGDGWNGVRTGKALFVVAETELTEIVISEADMDAVKNATEAYLVGFAPNSKIKLKTPLDDFTGQTDSKGLLTIALTTEDAVRISTQVEPGGRVSPSSLKLKKGDKAEFIIYPDSGYEVDKITGCGGKISEHVYRIDSAREDCTIKISFAQKAYSVTGESGEGGKIAPSILNVKKGDTATFKILPDAGYIIDNVTGCNGNLSENTYSTGPITENCKVTAIFRRISYIVNTAPGEGGRISPSSMRVNHGESTSFKILPDLGYGIDSVTGCGGNLYGDTYTSGPITGPCTIKANFINQGSHIVNAEAGKGGKISPVKQNVEHGDTTKFFILPNTGYAIDSVTGCGGNLYGNNYITAPVTGPCKIKVSFKASQGLTHKLTYEAGPNGTLAGAAMQTIKAGSDGSPVTAMPDKGYRFNGWSDGLNDNPRKEIAVDSDLRVKAIFAKVTLGFKDMDDNFINEIKACHGEIVKFKITGCGDSGITRLLLNGEMMPKEDLLKGKGSGNYELNIFQTGLYKIEITDGSETSNLMVIVYPKAGFNIQKQKVCAGGKAKIKVFLDGKAPFYPVRIPFVSEGATWILPENLKSGEIVINDPKESGSDGKAAAMEFQVCDDVSSFLELVFKIGDPMNAEKGLLAEHILMVSPEPIPPTVDLFLSQKSDENAPGASVMAVVQGKGIATIESVVKNVSSSGTISYEWSYSDQKLYSINQSTDVSRFVFNPSELPEGLYELNLKVTESLNKLSSTASIQLTIMRECPEKNIIKGSCGTEDTTSNRIPDLMEKDGILPNKIMLSAEGSETAETAQGLQIRPGLIAYASGKSGIQISNDDIIRHGGNAGGPTQHPYNPGMTNIGGFFDFEITGLSAPGQSVGIVIPLSLGYEIAEGSEYRKYSRQKGWSSFSCDRSNRIWSSKRTQTGQCPSMGSLQYEEGLQPGNSCILLVIEDGGPNDTDHSANGIISDPGGIAVEKVIIPDPDESQKPASGGGSSGGCFIDSVTGL